jgi:hypothetical protein
MSKNRRNIPTRRKGVVIFERRSGTREIIVRNDNGAFYTIEQRDGGVITQTVTVTDLGKAMAAAKRLLKDKPVTES